MMATVVANSGGTPQPDNGDAQAMTAGPQAPSKPGQKTGAKPGVPAGKSGGEITLSRAEAAALLVFETEDEKGTMKRAQEESGLSEEQIKILRNRADKARRAGYTLKAAQVVFKPLNHPDEIDQNGLIGQNTDQADAKKKPGKE